MLKWLKRLYKRKEDKVVIAALKKFQESYDAAERQKFNIKERRELPKKTDEPGYVAPHPNHPDIK